MHQSYHMKREDDMAHTHTHIPGQGSLQRMKHETPQMLILSAIAAPFNNRDACKDSVLTAGNETMPVKTWRIELFNNK